MTKSKEDCIKELKRVLGAMTGLLNKPYEEAKKEFESIRSEGRQASAECTSEVKTMFEDAAQQLEELIEGMQSQNTVGSDIKIGAQKIYDEAMKRLGE